jgi:hypothetical protein
MRDSELLALVAILAPLSLASIGGAASVYAPLQHQTVDVHHWLTGSPARSSSTCSPSRG